MSVGKTKSESNTLKNNVIKLDELIDSSPVSRVQWRVVIICFALAMIDGFDAQSIGYVAPIITETFSIPADLMGQLYSAALVGLMLGALVGSPLADKVGRKPVILGSVAIMGVFALLTATASSTTELFLYRFLTGLGLGGVMPNINILTAEFSPARKRATLMTSMFVGFPIGVIIGGIASAGLLKVFGWESVFVLGGILPLVMLPVVLRWLPESPRFLALKQIKPDSLAKIVNQIAPGTNASGSNVFETVKPKKVGSIKALFVDGRTPTTLLLWLVCFSNLLSMYAIIGWLPSVLKASGFPLDKAILATVLFSFGGVVGGLAIGALMDKFGTIKTMFLGFFLASIAVATIGQVTASLPVLLLTLFLAGSTALGSQFGLNAMTSNSYDTGSRATGLGWSLAVGRLGAIIGPVLVGIAVALEVPLSILFPLGGLPLLIASFAVLMLGRLKKAKD